MNIESIVSVKPNPNIPVLSPGDTVRVSTKIVEADKERIQVFQGVVIRVRRGGSPVPSASFTVRRVTYGVGVERTFPLYSPMLEKVEVVRHGKVRRAKLYYLRRLSGKASRIKEKRVEKAEEPLAGVVAEAEPPAAELVEPAEQPVAESAEPPTAELAEPPADKAAPTAAPVVEPTTEPKKE